MDILVDIWAKTEGSEGGTGARKQQETEIYSRGRKEGCGPVSQM